MGAANPTLVNLSYILQFIGFLGICYAWVRSLHEWRNGKGVPKTRRLLFFITTVTLSAYVIPALISVCYFAPQCLPADYRDILRLSNGTILFLYGLFKFLLYYTKEPDH